MTTIGNIGIGLFLLILIWIVALIIFVFGIKYQSNIAWIALGLAGFVTIILIIIPTEKYNQNKKEVVSQTYNYTIIYRNLVLLFLIISALIGGLFFFILHCIEPVRPKLIKDFHYIE